MLLNYRSTIDVWIYDQQARWALNFYSSYRTEQRHGVHVPRKSPCMNLVCRYGGLSFSQVRPFASVAFLLLYQLESLHIERLIFASLPNSV
jgi:hypothetical protein